MSVEVEDARRTTSRNSWLVGTGAISFQVVFIVATRDHSDSQRVLPDASQ
jgi:hypothetical protein